MLTEKTSRKDNEEAPDVLVINPPYLTLTSIHGVGHQVPLGLLMVGGALLHAGLRVKLLDAERLRLSIPAVVKEVRRIRPRMIMTGHAGSTPAHPICMRMLAAVKQQVPHIPTIYGGVYPTYHAHEILRDHPAVDVIVRGEGEATAVDLVRALLGQRSLHTVRAIAFRDRTTTPVSTVEREPLRLDDYPIGWQLIEDWDAYQCFGLGRAVILQLSRGCPHHCTYCGQHGFWMRWRHRDPVKLADEIEWLVRHRNVRFITLADENPTTDVRVWKAFLQEIAQRELPVKFFATIRASDIVRDAALMPLYAAAGIFYVLMGIETTDAATLERIRKGSSTRDDLRACRLLQSHGIHAIIGHIVGFGDERPRDFLRAFRQLRLYDGDYLNAMYVTPHAWTPFARESADRRVVQLDQTHWDYRHQILAQEHMRPWQLFAAVKLLELAFHLRPRRLGRMLTASRADRRQFWWGIRHTGRVWLGEIFAFLGRPFAPGRHITLREWYGAAGLGEHRHQQRLTSLRITRRHSLTTTRDASGGPPARPSVAEPQHPTHAGVPNLQRRNTKEPNPC